MRAPSPCRRIQTGTLLFHVFACTQAPGPDAGVSEVWDDGGTIEVGFDARGSADATEVLSLDAGVGDVSRLGDWVRAETSRGSLEGELISAYDQRRWWERRNDTILALFDPRRLAPFPEDRSLQFLSRSAITSLAAVSRPAEARPYGEVLASLEIAFHQSPFDRPARVITAHERYHLEEDGYGDFAWDFVMSHESGERFSGLGVDNEDFAIWDEPVYLPTSGVVIEVVNTAADNIPGSYPPGAVNNLVGIGVYGSFALYLLHFRQGTISSSVAVGQYLERGTYLGRVGNAGVSLEPHLHATMLWYDASLGRSFSVPSTFQGVNVASRPSGPWTYQAQVDPERDVWIMNP